MIMIMTGGLVNHPTLLSSNSQSSVHSESAIDVYATIVIFLLLRSTLYCATVRAIDTRLVQQLTVKRLDRSHRQGN
jgi:hypothetical protein